MILPGSEARNYACCTTTSPFNVRPGSSLPAFLAIDLRHRPCETLFGIAVVREPFLRPVGIEEE